MDGISRKVHDLRRAIESVIVNRSGIIDLVLTAFLAEGHVTLADVPGTGKTVLARALARSFHGDFRRVQFTPDVLPSDLTGAYVFNQRESRFEFRRGPIFCRILLADEINRGTPRTQSALLQAMEEDMVTVDGTSFEIGRPFFVIATQNPLEREGAFSLPFSELDRFMLTTSIGYPSVGEELVMLETRREGDPLDALEPVVTPADIVQWQDAVRRTRVDSSLAAYLLSLITETRKHPDLTVGASPRATLQVRRFAQARAFMQDRDFCTPDDIQDAFLRCLPHRILLRKHVPGAGNSADDVLRHIVSHVPVPV
jgi:MoxR-like ATPase